MILIVLAALFLTCLLVANIISVKLISIGGLMVPAGVIAYPLTFLFTDVISELYGRKIASRVIWTGFGANILMIMLVLLLYLKRKSRLLIGLMNGLDLTPLPARIINCLGVII